MLTAFGVSLLAGAGQLGLAFGFGIIRLTGTFTGATVNQWPAQLVWAGWFATNAAVIGALLAERLVRRDEQLTGTGRQLAVALSAALGALVVAPLCMQPARSAEVVSVDPVWAVAICAGLGAVVGAGATLAVLIRPPFAWNMAAVAGVMWLLALLSVLPSLGESGPLTSVRLGVLEPAWLDADTAQQLALLILPMLSLVAGAATGALARQYGHPPLIGGPSGAAGPVLVAFAYLAAGPGGTGDRYQLWPYYGALIAIAAGALGSAATALLPWSPGRPQATEAIEPTAILAPLPAAPMLPGPARRQADEQTAVRSPIALGATPEPTPSSPAPTLEQPTPTSATPTAADSPQAEAAGSPPHWHWPDDRTASRTPATTPGTRLPERPAAPPADTSGDLWVGDGSDIPATSQATAPPDAAPSDSPAGDETEDGTPARAAPRARRRFPMPDLWRATTWRLAPAQQPEPPASAEENVPSTDAEQSSPAREATPPAAEPPSRFTAPPPRISADPEAAIRDVTAAFAKPPVTRAEEVQPDTGDRDKGGRRGLFRRGRSRSADAGTEREEPLAAQDEEYVHWVAELSRPIPDDEPAPKKPRRSLRSTGRHHRD